MKRSLKVFSVLFLLSCVTSCAANNIDTSHIYEESFYEYDPGKYEGRIKSVDMTIVDITSGITHSNDPRYFEDSKPLDYYRRKEKLKLYYLDEIDEVYYVTLEDYANIFKDELLDGLVSTYTEVDGVATWTLFKDNKQRYQLSLDANKQTMSVYGGIDESFVKEIYDGKKGLNDYCESSEEYVQGHENKIRTYSFAKYGFDYFEVDGKYAYPFALLAAETSKTIERSFYYLSDYQEILEYGLQEQLDETTFKSDNGEIKFFDYVRGAYINKYRKDEEDQTRIAPASLTAFNKKLFYFIMDNYYGLAKQKNIKSMSDYFENFKESEDLLSPDGAIRGSAYAKMLQMLNDMHTSYTYSTNLLSETPLDGGRSSYSQTLYNDRINLQTLLGSLRKAAIDKYNEANHTELNLEGVRYSKDNKYSYFSFDNFMTYKYFGEGAVPEDDLLKDTFYLFVKNLNEAKAKGVKNVVIDISTNGGGYVGIMGKLLALMSKDNKSEMYLRADDNGSIQRMTTRVDSNKDGKFDVNDCYGNDFSFYLLTSNFSFSCGNAFPFYAQKNGYAKIIGQKSGGGECCVFSYTFPTGQGIGYSSPYHLGYYDAKTDTYEGDEVGAFPSITLSESFYDIYDVDVVASKVESYNEGLNQQ